MQQRDESTDGPVWWVRCGEDVLGSLSAPSGDQPWMVARFEPSEGWERVRHLFEAQAEARRLGFPEDEVGALKAVRRARQEGAKYLAAGAFLGLRNVAAHEMR